MYAPDGIRIDGKPDEWGGTFQAFNRSTSVFYSMANDEQNLYLVIQCDQQPTIAKILSGGITLVLKSSKDKQTMPVKVVYPLISYTDKYTISIPLREEANVDKMAAKINQQLPTVAKTINISGIRDIKEPTVSIYNDLGIKAVSQVDTRRAYTFELQVPLKYFRHLTDENGTFDYNVIVNGVEDPPGTITVGGSSSGGQAKSVDGAQVFDMFSPTDFKATYTLVKK